MRHRRLIFLNRFYRPDHSATSQILTDLAEYLAKTGADVTVITSRHLYDQPGECLRKVEEVDGVLVDRAWSLGFGRRKTLGRFLDYTSFLLGAAVALLKRLRAGDIIIAKTDPPFLGLLAVLIARLRGAHVVNWVQDLFPEVAFALGVKVPKVVRGPMVKARNLSLARAAANIAIGELMAERLRMMAGVENVRVINNWMPFSHVGPIDRDDNRLRAEWGLDGKFVVGYSGNMGAAHEFETLLGAAQTLRADPNVVFLLIGGGKQRELVGRRVEELGLTNVLIKPYQPSTSLAESLSAADVHVITLRPELEGFIVPSKIYGVLAAGRPALFVGSRDGEIGKLLTERSCGAVVLPGDSDGLVVCIEELRRSPSKLSALGKHAAVASDNLRRERALEKWASLLDSLPRH